MPKSLCVISAGYNWENVEIGLFTGSSALVPYILILAHKNKNLIKGAWVAGFPR